MWFYHHNPLSLFPPGSSGNCRIDGFSSIRDLIRQNFPSGFHPVGTSVLPEQGSFLFYLALGWLFLKNRHKIKSTFGKAIPCGKIKICYLCKKH
jgi:hypothetical protein